MFDEMVALCESAGITQAEWTLVGAIVGLGVGCLLIVTGIAARFGALLILIYLGAYLYFFQPFWTVPAAERLPHIMEALQTIALAGAMVIIAGNGAGAGALTSSRNSMDLFDDLGR